MRTDRRRVRAVFAKELRDFRHNGNIIYAMLVLPLVFLIQPVVSVLTISSSAATALGREHQLVYLLAIPALIPAMLASYTIVGERVQGTLEPLLATPIRSRELILGKALAVFVPSLIIAYTVFALFIVLTELLAAPGIASHLIRGSDVLAQVIFSPLITAWSIWVGMAISARSSDVRVAAQISALVSLPVVAVTSLIAFKVIPVSLQIALVFAAALLVLDRIGWRVATGLFDRERLITSTK